MAESSSNKAGVQQQTSAQQITSKDLPSLGALDEDDEFEEFDVQDWDDSQTLAAVTTSTGKTTSTNSLTVAGTGTSDGDTSAGVGDHLWEDNWDDDDREDEWSKSLKEHLAK